MGGFVRKVFGGGGKPDTSAYDRQLAEQREAARKAEEEARKAEEEAAKLKAQQKTEEQAMAKAKQGRASTILTGASGDESTSSVKRKTLLGA